MTISCYVEWHCIARAGNLYCVLSICLLRMVLVECECIRTVRKNRHVLDVYGAQGKKDISFETPG